MLYGATVVVYRCRYTVYSVVVMVYIGVGIRCTV